MIGYRTCLSDWSQAWETWEWDVSAEEPTCVEKQIYINPWISKYEFFFYQTDNKELQRAERHFKAACLWAQGGSHMLYKEESLPTSRGSPETSGDHRDHTALLPHFLFYNCFSFFNPLYFSCMHFCVPCLHRVTLCHWDPIVIPVLLPGETPTHPLTDHRMTINGHTMDLEHI